MVGKWWVSPVDGMRFPVKIFSCFRGWIPCCFFGMNVPGWNKTWLQRWQSDRKEVIRRPVPNSAVLKPALRIATHLLMTSTFMVIRPAKELPHAPKNAASIYFRNDVSFPIKNAEISHGFPLILWQGQLRNAMDLLWGAQLRWLRSWWWSTRWAFQVAVVATNNWQLVGLVHHCPTGKCQT